MIKTVLITSLLEMKDISHSENKLSPEQRKSRIRWTTEKKKLDKSFVLTFITAYIPRIQPNLFHNKEVR